MICPKIFHDFFAGILPGVSFEISRVPSGISSRVSPMVFLEVFRGFSLDVSLEISLEASLKTSFRRFLSVLLLGCFFLNSFYPHSCLRSNHKPLLEKSRFWKKSSLNR